MGTKRRKTDGIEGRNERNKEGNKAKREEAKQ
jgi:hypothetical protein